MRVGLNAYKLVATSAAVLGGLMSLAGGASATTTTHALANSSASCSIVGSSLVKKDLNLSASSPASSTPFPGELRCSYKVGSNASAVQVVYNVQSLFTFKQLAQGYISSGAKVLTGIGQQAYAPSIHKTGMSNSDVSFYSKGYSISIGAAVSLNSVETLAKFVASKI